MEDIIYPMGRLSFVEESNEELINNWIKQLENQPNLIRKAVQGLSEAQINLPYRDGGWTLRQIIHHIADAIVNAYIRFKLTLTEEKPQIKLWDEVKWADLEDGRLAPIDVSLSMIVGIIHRWLILLKGMKIEDFKKELIHPELGYISLDKMLQLYAWHGNHHTAQITAFRNRMNY